MVKERREIGIRRAPLTIRVNGRQAMNNHLMNRLDHNDAVIGKELLNGALNVIGGDQLYGRTGQAAAAATPTAVWAMGVQNGISFETGCKPVLRWGRALALAWGRLERPRRQVP